MTRYRCFGVSQSSEGASVSMVEGSVVIHHFLQLTKAAACAHTHIHIQLHCNPVYWDMYMYTIPA